MWVYQFIAYTMNIPIFFLESFSEQTDFVFELTGNGRYAGQLGTSLEIAL